MSRHVWKTGATSAVASIRASVCGSPEIRNEFRSLVRELSFVQIDSESEDPGRFEFPALESIYRFSGDCGESLPVMYFHTKGVSYSDDRYFRWREILNDGVISAWRIHLAAIASGADVSGQNYLNGDYKPHFSGNFWFGHTGYIAKLRDPSALNKRDRYEAEKWICSQPHRVHAMPFIEPN